MAINQQHLSYQQNSVTTAPPGELTLMLFNGCLKFIHIAKNAINEKNVELKNRNLVKAQNIIQELMVTLNMDISISKDMMALYDFIYRQLIEANLKNDTRILNDVEGLVTEFRDTWKQVIQINRQRQFAQGGQA